MRMTKYPLLLTTLFCAGLSTIPLAAFGQDSAASGNSTAPEPPSQSLFQESDEQQKTDKPADATPASSAPVAVPSLTDFLAQAATETPSDTQTAENAPAEQPPANAIDSLVADGADPNSPGMALGTGSPEDISAPAGKSLDEQKKETETMMRQEAFGAVTNQMLPLRPSEIRKILEMYDETSQAAETPVYPNPEPISAFKRISLDPGAKPLTVMTAMGNVTTVSIVDITGQPWPIQDLTWAGDFQIEQPESGSQMIRITPLTQFAQGNVSMRLVGLNPPVILSLKAERKEVHVRLDVQIPEVGPKGVLPPMEVAVSTKAGDDFMTSILMGVVKGKTERMKVDGIDGRTSAFSRGNMMYLRTPYTMLSPAWLQSVQSADGMKVYALNYTPVVLLSDKGSMVRAYISHKETVNEQ